MNKKLKRKYDNAYYAKMTLERKLHKQRQQNERRHKIVLFVFEYKKTHPCVDCGEDDPIVLEFDHLIQKNKEFNIADGCHGGFSLKKIINEINKCDVVCANCHKRRTFERYTQI